MLNEGFKLSFIQLAYLKVFFSSSHFYLKTNDNIANSIIILYLFLLVLIMILSFLPIKIDLIHSLKFARK